MGRRPIRINLDPIVIPQFPSQKDFRKFMFNSFRASEEGGTNGLSDILIT
jgi:hypothetical protein